MRFNVVFNKIQWNKSQCATSSESYVKLILSILDDLTTPLQQDCNIKVKGFTDSNLIYQFNHQSQIILFMLDELTTPLQLDCNLWVIDLTDSNSFFWYQFCDSKQIAVNIRHNFWIMKFDLHSDWDSNGIINFVLKPYFSDLLTSTYLLLILYKKTQLGWLFWFCFKFRKDSHLIFTKTWLWFWVCVKICLWLRLCARKHTHHE